MSAFPQGLFPSRNMCLRPGRSRRGFFLPKKYVRGLGAPTGACSSHTKYVQGPGVPAGALFAPKNTRCSRNMFPFLKTFTEKVPRKTVVEFLAKL